MATENNWSDIIRSNYTELLRNIDTDHGLYGELKKLQIFAPIALKSFWATKDTTKRIDEILQNLQKKDFKSFMKFCEALNNCQQKHIVDDYLSNVKKTCVENTDSAPIYSDEQIRPLSRAKLACLHRNWNDLIERIDNNEELLGELHSKHVFSDIQFIKLRNITEEPKRTEMLLGLLEKGSEKQYIDFCDALRVVKQSYIVDDYLMPPVKGNNTTKETHRHDLLKGLEIESKIRTSKILETIEAVPMSSIEYRFGSCSSEFLNKVKEKILQKEVYKCDSQPRGLAIIINNKYFTYLNKRDGAELDGQNLDALFKGLHFDTVLHSNKVAEDIFEILKKESSNANNAKYDVFVLFLLSHGIKGQIFGLDGKPVDTKVMISLFDGKNCPALINKPKLFFIQACQGDMKTAGVTVSDHQNTDVEQMMEQLKLDDDFDISLPIQCSSDFESDSVPDIEAVHEMADMAIIYATVEGYVAWRRKDTGSLFVQCLIDILVKETHKEDLMSMLTKVIRILHDKEVEENKSKFKQIGETRSSLRRKVYLLP